MPIHWKKQLILMLVISLAISVVFEATLFNYAHWVTSQSASEQVIADTSTKVKSGNGVAYPLDNLDVTSVCFNINLKENYFADVTISLSDSGTSQKLYPLPPVRVYKSGSYVVPVNPYGYVKALSLTVDSSNEADCTFKSISVNKVAPFEVSGKRLVLVFTILLFALFLRPKSVVWKINVKSQRRFSFVTACISLGVILFAMGISFAGATDDYDAPWYNDHAHNEYTELAKAFAAGQLYIDEEPPSWLKQLDGMQSDNRLFGESNLYDRSVRDSFAESTGQMYKMDAAYYNGHYYVYFGVVPVLTAYLPYYIATGQDLRNSSVCIVCLIGFVLFSFLILLKLYIRRYANAPLGAFICALFGYVALTSIVYTLARPSFYNVPVCFALAIGTLGVLCALEGFYSQKTIARHVLFGAGALLAASTIGCRPQLATMLLLVAIIVFKALVRVNQKERLSLVLVALVPIVLVTALLMTYNQMRFGSPFDFGANYNITGNDMTLRHFDAFRAVEGVFYYFLDFPSISLRFPFMQPQSLSPAFMGITIWEPFVCGLMVAVPCGLFPFVYCIYNRGLYFERALVVGALAIAVFAAAFDAEGAGILGRYMQDFGILVGFAFSISLLDSLNRNQWGNVSKGLLHATMLVTMISCVLVRLSLLSVGIEPSGAVADPATLAKLQSIFMFWI